MAFGGHLDDIKGVLVSVIIIFSMQMRFLFIVGFLLASELCFTTVGKDWKRSAFD